MALTVSVKCSISPETKMRMRLDWLINWTGRWKLPFLDTMIKAFEKFQAKIMVVASKLSIITTRLR